jgi:DNA-binding MarR family transcriptional regulator
VLVCAGRRGVDRTVDMQPPLTTPAGELDEVVHQRYRLAILAFLSRIEMTEFTTLRDAIGLTDGNLNRHLAMLAGAELVTVKRSTTGGQRARTWIAITGAGRAALEDHVATLRRMLDGL